ncbi:Phosphatidylinositol 4-phosphate 5-kinase 9 [Vitis vinifera]|uniref:Phosphatidylinositol 4-phosphate 5-kinase 9 n=1 Tax=Vitis vinifera TaxID=29760 RepID=A0A438JS05_VITVI|nr:Phosphatidylinositol 4-phosphate 5-kinase 9 [Vitis vinifera]
MSGPVATGDVVEGAISRTERTKSLDAITSNGKDYQSILTNGEVLHASSETVGFKSGNLFLPNGECYSGSLLGSVPEGPGKYVWSDGCVYEGGWRRGMRNGNGKIRWSSGAAYEGEFSGGYMHGTGTYIGPDNMTYNGRWRLNLKHGLGYQNYPNGDVFEGSWIQGTPEGPGKYTWANGNVYLGNMKGGKMSGKGTLTWTNGDSFEGSWLNGMMHGFGVYTWSDGGYYVGTWTRGLKDGKGAFYPKGSSLPALQQLYINALRKRGLLPDLKKQFNVSTYSSCIISGYGKRQGWWQSDNRFSPSSRSAKRRQKKLTKDVKRPGEAIIKGHRSYDLMLSLQLGIRSEDFIFLLGLDTVDCRYTVGKITPIQRREVRASDFGPRASFWMSFPKEGSQLTPPHQSEDFKWKDYCPMVFSIGHIRRKRKFSLIGVDCARGGGYSGPLVVALSSHIQIVVSSSDGRDELADLKDCKLDVLRLVRWIYGAWEMCRDALGG